jgi:agmatine/peptidylarginine deiminase
MEGVTMGNIMRILLTLILTALMAVQLPALSHGVAEPADIDTGPAMPIEGETVVAVPPNSPPPSFPPTPIRMPAEFEPLSGVLIRYPFGISYAIIAEISENIEVVTVVADSSQQATVESAYAANGVHLDNCTFLHAPTNTYWTRDYGPWFVFNGNDELGIVNHSYNRPRPLDDAIPERFGENQSLPIYDMPLEHTGGNYMTDGLGAAMSTDLVYDENPGLTNAEVDQTLKDYLGITTHHAVSDPTGTYIRHIDCWAKLLSPDTILVARVAIDDDRYLDYEAAAQYFENQTCGWGYPYNVVRVDTPGGQPYTNSLIANGKVLVPITGSGWDDDALAVYEAAMPGYEVIGFTGSWAATDALHCRTHEIIDRGMLYINHTPVRDLEPPVGGVPFPAQVIPYSGESLTGVPGLRWNTGGGWQSKDMSAAGNDIYTTTLPAQPDGTLVEYYIHAEDDSGRSENHPYIGAPGAHNFTIRMVPPDISGAAATPSSLPCGSDVNISADVTDNVAVDMVYVDFEYPSGTAENITMSPGDENLYSTVRGFVCVGQVNYTISAVDVNGNWNSTGGSFDVWDSFAPVAEAGPDQLVPQGTVVYFDASGSSDNVAATEYRWDLTDGSSKTLYGPSPFHTFADVGVYPVTLTVWDAKGNSDTDLMNVTVYDITLPVAYAGQDREVDRGEWVELNGSGSTDNVAVVNHTWSLDDGGPVEFYGASSGYAFTDAGEYEDSLIVTVRDITPPVADAGDDMVVDQNANFTLDGSGSTDNVGIVEYTWTLPLKDVYPVIKKGETASASLPEAGTFTITLTAEDAQGNKGTDTLNVTSLDTEPPTASGKADIVTGGDTPEIVWMDLDGAASRDNVGIVNYTWIIRHNVTQVTQFGEVILWPLPHAGLFIVTLTVTDARGNSNSDGMHLNVSEFWFPDEGGEGDDGADIVDGTDGDENDTTDGTDGDDGPVNPNPVDGTGGVDGKKEGMSTAAVAGIVAAVVAVLIILALLLLLWKKKGGGGDAEEKGGVQDGVAGDVVGEGGSAGVMEGGIAGDGGESAVDNEVDVSQGVGAHGVGAHSGEGGGSRSGVLEGASGTGNGVGTSFA